DADCDDALYCNGTETCVEGQCQAGEPVVCNDAIACTEDICSEVTRQCRSVPPDNDGDGHFDNKCVDESGTAFGQDCDDEDPRRFPGNIEICDAMHHDEDCNPQTNGERDVDGDGYFDDACCNKADDA